MVEQGKGRDLSEDFKKWDWIRLKNNCILIWVAACLVITVLVQHCDGNFWVQLNWKGLFLWIFIHRIQGPQDLLSVQGDTAEQWKDNKPCKQTFCQQWACSPGLLKHESRKSDTMYTLTVHKCKVLSSHHLVIRFRRLHSIHLRNTDTPLTHTLTHICNKSH